MNVILLFMLSVLGTVLLVALVAGVIILASARRARRDSDEASSALPPAVRGEDRATTSSLFDASSSGVRDAG